MARLRITSTESAWMTAPKYPQRSQDTVRLRAQAVAESATPTGIKSPQISRISPSFLPPSNRQFYQGEMEYTRKMLALDRLFPQKFCINLQRRPDRWDKMLHQFRLHDIQNVIRHDAVDGRGLTPRAEWKHGAGAYGCLLSHLGIVRKAQESGLPAVLILEDDVVFHDDFQERFEEYAS